MAFLGMDVEQVQNLSRQLDQKATDITNMISTLNSTLQSTEWKGPDADQFRNDWNSTLSQKLRQVSESLKQASQSASRNAREQQEVANR
jgi:hypothetical protein